MHYVYSELQARAGDVVEITLDQQANVFLLDPGDYSSYQRGQQFHYIGGRALRSPLRIPVPSSGRWYAVIDLGGYSGTIRYGIRLLRRR